MPLDMMSLFEDDARSRLGNGDWQLIFEDKTQLIITPTWRQQIIDYACELFVRWVINGYEYKVNYDGYYSSSKAYRVDSKLLLIKYDTLSEWCDEYTGNRGFHYHWMTYEDIIREFIEEKTFDVVLHTYMATYQMNDEEVDELQAFDDALGLLPALQFVLPSIFTDINTQDVWAQYETLVRKKLAEEVHQRKIRQARHQYQKKLVDTFWQAHFSHLVGKRIEKPEFDDMKFAEDLSNILLDTDPEIIEAIIEIDVPQNVSNSVREIIKNIAKQALE